MIRNKTVQTVLKSGFLVGVGLLAGSYVEKNYQLQSQIADQCAVSANKPYVNQPHQLEHLL